MAESQYPRGIQELIEMPSVLIYQKYSMKNNYRVLSPNGSEVLNAKEDSSLLQAMFIGSKRSFHMAIQDVDNVQNIDLWRPFTFGTDKMEVTVGRELVAIVRKEPTFLKPVLNVNDASDRPVMRIKGPIVKTAPCEYNILDRDKNQIGVIRKMWGGIKREMLNCDTFEIIFPPKLDVRFKAALIGTCMFIDFLFYTD